MKTLIATGRNIIFTPRDDKLELFIEAVFYVLAEPQCCFTGDDGILSQTREPQSLRFIASPSAMRAVARNLLKWADEADEIGDNVAAGIEIHEPREVSA